LKLIPKTVERVIIKAFYFQCGQEEDDQSFIDLIKYLNDNNLFKDDRYQYYQHDVPISLNTTVLIWNINQMIPHGVIPFGVKRIIFGESFDQHILFGSIPTSVTEINFGYMFNQLQNSYLPESIKYLSIYKCDIEYPNWPRNLIQLKIRADDVDYRLFAALPKSIQYLYVNKHRFKQDYDNDTPFFKAKSIYSNGDINERSREVVSEINEYIDQHKDKPVLDIKSDASIINSPTTDIEISIKYTTKPLNINNIKSIYFNGFFNQSLPEGSITSNRITKMVFSKNSEFNQQMFVVPASVQHLELGCDFNQPLKSFMIPSSLTKLHLSSKFNQVIPIGLLPNGLKVLDLGESYKYPIVKGTIPDTVEELSYTITSKTNTLVYLPQSITKLNLKLKCWDESILNTIPSTINHLCFIKTIMDRSSFNGSFKFIFNIQSFIFNVQSCMIPPTITKLEIQDEIFAITNIDQLPSSVKSLYLDNDKQFTGFIPPTVEYVELKYQTRPLLTQKQTTYK